MEYTFLLSKSWRSEHVKAKNLREAWRKTKQWYQGLTPEDKERVGILEPVYQFCKDDEFVMSGWIGSNDKKLR